MALKLNSKVATSTDVARLIRELTNLESAYVANKARKDAQPVTASEGLSQLATDNKIDIVESSGRQTLTDELNKLTESAPTIHISFASEPSEQVIEKILAWLRTNIDPQVLLRIGLQPSIAAGCVLRTPNKMFDLSLRSNIVKQEPYLMQIISGASK